MWTTVLLLLALCAAGLASGRVLNATTGRDIALGYADYSVDIVMVLNDVAWTDEDWAGIPVPVLLKRDFAVIGRAPGPDGLLVTWDSNYVSKKVRLVNSTMTLRNFVVLESRRVNQNLAPGCDMLEPCAAGDWGRVVLDSSFLVQRLCYPASMHSTALAGVVRPRGFPGTQAYRALVPQPACQAANSSASSSALQVAAAPPPPAVAPQLQCWSHMGAYDDLGMFCADLDASQKQVLVGYTLLMTNVTYVCADIISDDCVAQLGTVGCYDNWAEYKAQHAPSPPPSVVGAGGDSGAVAPPANASSGSSSGGGGGGGLSGSEEVLVGAIVGGVGGALLVGAVVCFFMWRRRKAAKESTELPLANKDIVAIAHAEGVSSAWVLCPRFCWPRSERYGAPPCGDRKHQDSPYASPAAPGSIIVSEALHGKDVCIASKSATTQQQLSLGVDDPDANSSGEGCGLDGADVAASSGMSAQHAQQHESEEALAAGGIYDTVEVVTLETPQRAEVKAEVLLDPRVTLLPKQLGRGTFGRVVEGRYQGQRVALKLLNDSAFGFAAGVTTSTGALQGMRGGAGGAAKGIGGTQQGDGDEGGNGNARQIALDALVQEVQILGRCRHPNVVRLLAACLTPPRLCLVMELMETSLERMLYGGGPDQPLLPLGTVLDIALDVAQGLSYLHPTIVHRDLKPGNVLVNLNGGKRLIAKLSDFGLSRIQRTVVETENPEAGTPGYMAPELFDVNNFSVSHKLDVYSYAILLWSMLSGKEPWKDLTLVQMAYRVAGLHERPPLDVILPERQPPKMIRVITSCWDPEPERRPAAAEVVKQLLLIKHDFERASH
ncbi:hypothetical protein CHLRE_16g654900v5 [Chlamydomonas reinhardtii]|uniref:Protein kinase domain-containing protein n=1 Tax=Chlamydomonas reinhardtii TaxID=3055 RepID=A0A2K3CT37_CHLRE|nr:uncharacterized protein CHLRE_16g654900v5 [Chlamydomonas reinhardtii]PNW71450.1 hypothetical protein CHLRE_16g654900v5 [Chlamydomonas reinhardtii]